MEQNVRIARKRKGSERCISVSRRVRAVGWADGSFSLKTNYRMMQAGA
jgi:hypothetical protein